MHYCDLWASILWIKGLCHKWAEGVLFSSLGRSLWLAPGHCCWITAHKMITSQFPSWFVLYFNNKKHSKSLHKLKKKLTFTKICFHLGLHGGVLVSTVVWWLAPLPHNESVPDSTHVWAFLCGACMFPLCMHGFSPGTSSHCPKSCMLGFLASLKLSLGGVCGCLSCLSLCGPVMDWQPIQGVPRLSPDDRWDILQLPRDPTHGLSGYRKWMDG